MSKKKQLRLRLPEGIDELTAEQYQALTSPSSAPNSEPEVRMNKYNNKVIVIDGIEFQSIKEGNYYTQLQWQLAAKEIKGFKMQVKYILLDGIKGMFRQRSYYADFVVEHLDGSFEVIDTKGVQTQLYRIKKHLLYLRYKILITEK